MQATPLNIWLVSPYHTGSHRAWASGFAAHSRHRVRLLTLDGRFWKWRMQGGALQLAQSAEDALRAGQPDAILCTDMLNLPAWLALLRGQLDPQIPALLYMHENQLTYPWRAGEKIDLTYALINWTSQCCAQSIAFNSAFHREAWFGALPNLLKHFPDYNQLPRIVEVKARSRVLPVGIELPSSSGEGLGVRSNTDALTHRRTNPPLILWNQRWEYDKRPDRFFALLYRLEEAGVDFRLAVAGENFRNAPVEFEEARGRLAPRIVHWGFAVDAAEYRRLLAQSDLVVSTADHEFFGISILEAVVAGAMPLLPRRLSYPELFPADFADTILYTDEDDLFQKARAHLISGESAPPALREHIRETYAWAKVAAHYDEWLEQLVNGR